MTTFLCGPRGTGLPPIDPDGACCWTAVQTEGTDCSCWEPIYSATPTRDVQAGPPAVRDSMCHDCAYRPGSPERTEQGGGQLDVDRRRPFVCHQGMPVLLGYTVPSWQGNDGVWQTGAFCVVARLVHDRDNFGPITRGPTAWKTDGTLADVCGGWASVARMR